MYLAITYPTMKLVINEEQAELVRRIYQEYLEGKSYQAIADGLERDGIPTVTGNKKGGTHQLQSYSQMKSTKMHYYNKRR